MRLFTAIDLPAAVKDQLKRLLDRLRPLATINWSPLENLHITTKFIGEWPDHRLDEIKRALAGVTSSDLVEAPIEIAVGEFGWFPNARRPRVFWVGIDGGSPLQNLARATDRALATIGVPIEVRDYSPHLTLARLRDHPPLDVLRTAAESTHADCGTFRATEFLLYLSTGGKYTKLAAFSLGRAA